MKRILIFSLVYFPRFVGGAEVALKEITDRLPSDRYEFDVITLRFDRDLPAVEKVGNVTVHRIGYTSRGVHTPQNLPKWLHLQKYLFPFTAALKARALQNARPYDATWSLMANYAGFAALFFSWMCPRIPFLLTLQEGDPFEYIKGRVGLLYPLYRRIFRRATFVQAISSYLLDYAERMGSTAPRAVVANGVDIALFSKKYSDQEKMQLRASLGIPPEQKIIITTGRLAVKNGVTDLVKSLVHIPEQPALVFVGTGPQEAEVRALVQELGLEKQVHFVGYKVQKDIPPYLAISDVFVRPALSEGFGNSYVEAMAAGVPVVATPVGGIVDFLFDRPKEGVAHSPTGLFCHPEDAESIAQAIRHILNDAPLRATLITNARALVSERYDWSRIARDMDTAVFTPLLS